MFHSTATRIAQRISDVVDDMLLGDYDYIEDRGVLYADVDYFRAQTHRCMPGTEPARPRRGAQMAAAARRPGTLDYKWERERKDSAAICACLESAAFLPTA